MQVDFIYGNPSRPECGDLFGGWLTEYNGNIFMVDCGVGSGGPSLVRRLKERLDGRRLDYVLLTHIHLDHAGGLGAIFQAFPETKAIVHKKGLRHLVEPERLWAGTVKVMRELAEMYGHPQPIDPARLIPHTEARMTGLKIFETPGHAPHHLSYRLGPIMFAGEAAGCPYHYKGLLYNRPATPPRYCPEITDNSIEKLLKESDGSAYCAHYHHAVPLHDCLRLYRKQLAFWDEHLRRPEAVQRAGENYADWLDRLTDGLFQADPNLGPLLCMAEEGEVNLWAERYFIRNAVEGFIQYYQEEKQAAENRLGLISIK